MRGWQKKILVLLVASLIIILVFPQALLGQQKYQLLEPSAFPEAGPAGEIDPSTYFSRLYRLALSAAVVLALLMIVIAGVQYSAAGVSPAAKENAKERIRDAIWGLLLALFSYLILRTINPALVSPALEGIRSPEEAAQAVEPVGPIDQEACFQKLAERQGGIYERNGQFNSPALDQLIRSVRAEIEVKRGRFLGSIFTFDTQGPAEEPLQARYCHLTRGVPGNQCGANVTRCSHSRLSKHYGAGEFKFTRPQYYGSNAVDFGLGTGANDQTAQFGALVIEIARLEATGITPGGYFRGRCEDQNARPVVPCNKGGADHVHIEIWPQ